MTAYFVRRFLLMIPTLLGVTMIAFGITRMVPGGPLERAVLQFQQGSVGRGEAGSGGGGRGAGGQQMPAAALEQLKQYYGLDKPGYIAYFEWLGKVVKLDLGESFTYRKPVWVLIRERLPISLTFGLSGFLLAYLISIPLGIFKAIRHGGIFDVASSAVVFIGYSIPAWALGALLLVFLASGQFYRVAPLGNIRTSSYDDLPKMIQATEERKNVSDEFGSFQWNRLSARSKTIDYVYHMYLPVLCYLVGSFATITVLTKNSLMESLGQDYVRTAFAKGLSPWRVIVVHAMRNSLIPLATGLGHAISLVMAGSYLIEYVFNIDGLGYLGYNAIIGRDYTVVLGVLLINTFLGLFGNILSDVLYALIDPRIRFE